LDNEVINKRDYYKKQRKAFLNEARILSSLFDIKEVVKVLDYFEERENAYIVMEFVQGISLRQYLESRNQPMSFTEAWNFLPRNGGIRKSASE
jgi:serine/threonine protein kinase